MRPSKEAVDAALGYASLLTDATLRGPFDASLSALADEVRALREEGMTLPQIANEITKAVVTQLKEENAALREKLSRVEELPDAWRTESSGLDSEDVAFCIQDLESALRGYP